MDLKVKISPLGESALTISLGNVISEKLNRRILCLAEYFEKFPFPGFIENVPAYSSLSIFYDPLTVNNEFDQFPTAFAAVRQLVEKSLTQLEDSFFENPRRIEIPVSFDTAAGPDLALVAEENGLTPKNVIEIFLARTYRVYMLGFLPGFAYLGELDERIATPRKITPRKRVPKGSVGIAGSQTGIYPLESPGGWQIIGRTSAELFTPGAEYPTLFQPGDLVKFISL